MWSADDVVIIRMPAHWAPAILRNDFSGLDSEDRLAVREALDEIASWGYVVLATVGDEYFSWNPDFGEPGMLLDYVALPR